MSRRRQHDVSRLEAVARAARLYLQTEETASMRSNKSSEIIRQLELHRARREELEEALAALDEARR